MYRLVSTIRWNMLTMKQNKQIVYSWSERYEKKTLARKEANIRNEGCRDHLLVWCHSSGLEWFGFQQYGNQNNIERIGFGQGLTFLCSNECVGLKCGNPRSMRCGEKEYESNVWSFRMFNKHYKICTESREVSINAKPLKVEKKTESSKRLSRQNPWKQ